MQEVLLQEVNRVQEFIVNGHILRDAQSNETMDRKGRFWGEKEVGSVCSSPSHSECL